MQAIEFETTAYQHSIKIPETVPDGVPIRVLLLLEDRLPAPDSDIKSLLTTLTEGLTEEDLLRSQDVGRDTVQWDI